MILNKLILSALKDIGAPVAFQKYKGSASTYVTFFEYNQNGALYADDAEQKTSHSIQVDIWSKEDYTQIYQSVKAALLNIGFRRIFETELYENDTEIYHKVLRFNFTE
ncbi:hypothetical protein [Bacillus sp. AG4(2022)]|uniref:hypothetical protein n=1 Tax=Bacillus sp. AG4(2022) TaxID=2962594 RepID=UPI002882790D|nr:hypothetical protein [Bacillus sp. AG4(2022)]MDT0163820.1 hypothetical protein [Bacillus sp. AG4(2022)]